MPNTDSEASQSTTMSGTPATELPIMLENLNDAPVQQASTSEQLSTLSSEGAVEANAESELTAPALSAKQDDLPNTEMTTPSSRADNERLYKQDYIARIRYSNALPPPPGPPKLLNIPVEGLAHYTSPAFASRLAREQPLNIEADAFLGMPIDLVGMPGIFDGDESSIQAPLVTPPVHPRDKALLRPLASLGKPKTVTSGVSFLRRTEYISSEQGRARVESNSSRKHSRTPLKKKQQPDVAKDDPINILRSTLKGFDIQNPEDVYTGPDTPENIRGAKPTVAELDAWKNPVHPSKPDLKVIDSYPVLPDLDALTDSSGYMVAKFATNPTTATDAYDTRMDVGLLHPIEPDQRAKDDHQAKIIAHEADPTNNPPPGPPPSNFEFFLPKAADTVSNIKKKLDVDNPDKDSSALYINNATARNPESFRYDRVRVYETGQQSSNSENVYREIALALHDPESENDRQQKAAYYYPILQKMQLKPRRNKNLAALGMPYRADDDDENDLVDFVDLEIREPNEMEALRREKQKADLDVKPSDDVQS